MDNRYDTIAICKDNYNDESAFWCAIGEQLKLLTDNGYICTFEHEDVGVYIIRFNHSDVSWGCPYPYWLTPEEEESVVYEGEDKVVSL